MAILVKYNSQTLSPTPTVSRNYQFLDAGTRRGQIESIELGCSLTGLSTPDAAITSLTGMFPAQFKTLQVFEDASLIYQWDNLVLQEVSFPQSALPVGGFVPYNVKFLSYQVPSGVIDPSNEYSFTQSEDGTVTVNHKISAKGVKTSIGAFNNAVNFVNNFVGQNPYTSCAPSFVPNGSGILLSKQEAIDRAACTYSVNETYKYTTGSTANYIETTTLDINDSINQDFTTIDLNVKWKGGLTGSVLGLRNSFTGINFNQILSNYGLATSNISRSSFSVSEDSGANSIDAKATFSSGENFSGYFDYAVSMDEDLTTEHSDWRVEGEFICKGPISYRRSRVDAFKTANQSSSYIPYLVGLVTGSALYNTFANFYITPNAVPSQLSIAENTGTATLKLSAAFSDEDRVVGLAHPKYSIEMDASKWIYELLPAANIEGHYTVQDLQMKSQAKMRLSMDAEITGDLSAGVDTMYSILSVVSGIYMDSGYCTAENTASGIADGSVSYEILGHDKMGTGMLASRVHGNIVNAYIRPPTFKFGY